MGESLSIVIPSKNEEKGLTMLLPELQAQYKVQVGKQPE